MNKQSDQDHILPLSTFCVIIVTIFISAAQFIQLVRLKVLYSRENSKRADKTKKYKNQNS